MFWAIERSLGQLLYFFIRFYRVVGPKIVRPNSEYHVAVSTQETSVPTSVVVQIVGRQETGRVFTAEQSLVIEPYATRIVRLEVKKLKNSSHQLFNDTNNCSQIGDVDAGDYRLIARGNGGVSFETSTVLKFVKKSYSVFIQTDKSVYKPGHKMLFRAIILNSGLRPAAEVRNELLNIKVSVIFFSSSKQIFDQELLYLYGKTWILNYIHTMTCT